jgi:hypothetical protein
MIPLNVTRIFAPTLHAIEAQTVEAEALLGPGHTRLGAVGGALTLRAFFGLDAALGATMPVGSPLRALALASLRGGCRSRRSIRVH